MTNVLVLGKRGMRKLCRREYYVFSSTMQIIKLLDNQMALTSLSGVEKEVSLALYKKKLKR